MESLRKAVVVNSKNVAWKCNLMFLKSFLDCAIELKLFEDGKKKN